MSNLAVAATTLLTVCVMVVAAGNGPLMHIVVDARTAFQAGHIVGTAAKSIIASRLAEPDVLELFDWSLTSHHAQALNASLWEASIASLPDAIDEMRGMAEGASQPFEKIWFLNVHVEIQTLQQQLWPDNSSSSGSGGEARRAVSHCTDVFAVTSLEARAWGHNEDGSLNDQNHTYLVTMHLLDASGTTVDNYTSFAYAGSLGGGSFAFNQWGLIFSDNSLFPNNSNFQLNHRVLPQRLLHRIAFRKRSIEDVVATFAEHQTSTGFSFNVGVWNALVVPGRLSFVNIETDPLAGFAVRRYDPPMIQQGHRDRDSMKVPVTEAPIVSPSRHMYHGNLYEALTTAQSPDPPTVARVDRLEQMGDPTSPFDIAQRLGDTANPLYPVYRTWRPSDQVVTVATAIFHLADSAVYVYTANPKFFGPVHTFHLNASFFTSPGVQP